MAIGYNSATYKGDTVTDRPNDLFQTYDAVYRGKKAGLMYYKGKLVWNGQMNFWRWAHKSSLGGGAFRNPEYYQNVYVPITQKQKIIKGQYGPVTASFMPGEYLHTPYESTIFNYGEIYQDTETNKYWVTDPPFVKTKEYNAIQGETQIDDAGNYATLKFNVIGTKEEPETVVHQIDGPGFGFQHLTIKQTSYPFGIIQTGTVWLPPGTYRYRASHTPSGVNQNYGPYGGAYSRSYNFGAIGGLYFACYSTSDFIGLTDKYDLDHSQGLNTIVLSHHLYYEFTLDKAAEISLSAEVSASDGGQTISWTPVFGRIDGPAYEVRAGQLRGRINTKQDGTGEEFTYVVNDTRREYEGVGELSVLPTEYLDPETLEYVTATCKRATARNYTFEGTVASLDVSIWFDNGRIRIRKYEKKDDNTYQAKDYYLYYIEGFYWYGKSEAEQNQE